MLEACGCVNVSILSVYMFVPCLFPMNMSCSIYQDSNLCSSVSQSFLTRNVLIMTLRPHRPQSNQIIISHHPKPTIIMYIQCRSQDPSLELLPPGTYIPPLTPTHPYLLTFQLLTSCSLPDLLTTPAPPLGTTCKHQPRSNTRHAL